MEFSKAFWQVVGKIMVDSLNYSYDHGEIIKFSEGSYHHFNWEER